MGDDDDLFALKSLILIKLRQISRHMEHIFCLLKFLIFYAARNREQEEKSIYLKQLML